MKQEPTPIRSLASAACQFSCAAVSCFRSLVFALLSFGLSQSAFADITMQSYWQLGEGATVGADNLSANDGEINNFNNSAGTTILTVGPSGAAGSTAYAHTSGVNFQGLWMFGGGANNQTVPADNWGVQVNVRIPTLPATGTYKAVFGMAEGVSGGLVIEANNIGGTTYFDVNKQATANYIIPRNASVTVAANTWYNLALVKSGGTTSFYVNGSLAGSNAGAINTSGLLGLGFEQNVGTHQLSGDFDEARFFTFAPGAFNAATDLSMTQRAVAYSGNGNTGGTAPADANSYFPGTSVTVLGAGTLTRTGYVFTGWNTQTGGGGTSYSPAATFNIGDADSTLYAQWAAATATITAAATFPTAITTTYGTPSDSTSVAVSGVNLATDITATAPDNLEVSSDNTTFGTTATFTQTGGNASGTLYVRIKNNAPVSGSPYDGQSVVLTSSGATPVNVATTVSGNTVTPKVLTVPSATAQDKMFDGNTTGTVIGTLQTAQAFGVGNSGDGIPYIGDTLTVSAPGTFASTAVGGPYTVTVGTFILGGSSAANYSLTQPVGLTLSASILNTATWTELAGGSWNSSANWLNGIIGTGADNTADFSTLDLTAPTTVTLASPQTIGGLVFGDTTPDNDWSVSGSTLTLAASTTPVINVSDQTATISSVLAGTGMVKTGTGILALNSTTSGTMDLTANDGTLRLAAAALNTAWNNPGGCSNGGTLTVNSGSTLQIASAYNIGYQQVVNINDGTLDIARNVTGDGQNYTLNLNFTGGGAITSSTGSCLRWGELADATITVNGTTPATISSILRMIPGNSRTGTINVVDAGGNLDFYGNIIDYPGIPGGVPLIKTGAGTLTLGGTNDYTSNTTVNAGTLTLAAGAQLGFTLGATSGTCNSLSGAGTVILDGNFAINTTAASALTTGSWTLENVPSLTGAYGTTFSVVGFTDAGSDKWTRIDGTKLWTFDETTGVLTLSAASYTSWIDSFTFALGADKTPTGDPDGDGINNATEMVLGGNPAIGMDAALAPSIELVTADLGVGSTDYLLFTCRRTDLSVTAGLFSNVQYGTNLSGWTSAVDGVGGVVVQVDDNFTFVPTSPNTDRIRVYVPRGSNTTLFGRLGVTVP